MAASSVRWNIDAGAGTPCAWFAKSEASFAPAASSGRRPGRVQRGQAMTVPKKPSETVRPSTLSVPVEKKK